jgi:hypothetical protein
VIRYYMEETVIVRAFEVWDSLAGGWVRQPLKSPQSRIVELAKSKAVRIIEGFDEIVATSRLDRFDRYDPNQV